MRARNICLFLLAGLVLLASALPAQAQDTLSVARITPQGEDVASTRQIIIEFNRPVVALGKMDRTQDMLGITISPDPACQWRWLNAATLACNLGDENALKPATAYMLDIATDKITTLDGLALEKAVSHRFVTERADISYHHFRPWEGSAQPVIRALFNQPTGVKSVAAHVYLQAPDKTRHALEVSADPDDTDPTSVTASGDEARNSWLLRSAKPLQRNTEYKLMVEAGMEASGGTELSATAREVGAFYTYPDFAFAGIQCTNNDDKTVLVSPDKAQADLDRCNPLQPVSLAFTAPVLRSVVKENLTVTPSLSGNLADYDPWGEENRDWSRIDSPHMKDQLYFVGLPVGLQAAKDYSFSFTQKKLTFWQWLLAKWRGTPVAKLQDEFGRTLDNDIAVQLATNNRKPNFVLVHHDAVLEKATDSDVPLYVNNLLETKFDYTTLTAKAIKTGQSLVRKVKPVQDVQYALPFGIREILGGQSGAVFGQLQTTPDTKQWEGAGRLFAQVTPYQIHAKLGHFQSLVWVTDLQTGKPVADAKVRIITDSFANLGRGARNVAQTITGKDGTAQLPGLVVLDPKQELVQRWGDNDTRLFVRVDKGDDMALLPIASPYFADTWRFYENNVSTSNQDEHGHMKAWGMTAQGVYRAGDTMQYKVYLRTQDNNRLITPPTNGRYTLRITDPMGQEVETRKNITFSRFGAVDGEYTIPANTPVGWYQFTLEANFNPASTNEDQQEEANSEGEYQERKGVFTLAPMRVLVSDFTPAAFRVTTELNGDHFVMGDKMAISSMARMHAGGAYTDANVRVTATLRPRGFTPDTPAAQGFTFASVLDDTADLQSVELLQKTDALDDKGDYASDIKLDNKDIIYGQIQVESAVQDDRGKAIAGYATAEYVGVDRLVGLRSTEWVYPSGKPAQIETLVVDDKGKPVSGVKVKGTLEREEIATAKVKGAGNAYLSENTREWVEAGRCDITSSTQMVPCAFTPEKSGTYRLSTEITDSKGRPHKTTISFWVSGDEYVQWDNQSDFVLPIIAEKATYKVGDTARYLVKNPFPDATALVAIERYGVLDSFTTILQGSTPVLEIPVKPDYLPGFYVSVVVQSPRVESPPPKLGDVDMGKPTFRMGYTGTKVVDDYKMLRVKVDMAQDTYRPGEEATATITVQPDKNAANEPVEIAVAVVDEAVFDLITDGKAAYDPYNGFYSLDALDMRNYTLMSALLGRQKFDKKGANPGGDGGVDVNMRSITRFVSYWNPSLKPDASGKAIISFPTPDNLTGWRVLALATTQNDRMGLGDGSFKVNRPTELRPVMPNQVREGDQFNGGFSVMNRTDKKRDITVTLTAKGDVTKDNASVSKTITLDAYKRQTVMLPLTAGMLANGRQGQIHFTATAGDALDKDALSHVVPVANARVYDVSAMYGSLTDPTFTQDIALPENVAANSTTMQLDLSPTVMGNLDGAFSYMRDYAYLCWEQKLTKATMASLYQRLQPYLSDKTRWEGSKDLPKTMLQDAALHQAPNGGMAYFVPSDERADPYLSAYTALAFTWLEEMGHTVPQDVSDKLDGYLDSFLRGDGVPDYYQPGMASDVQAVALHALAARGEDIDLSRYAEHAEKMSLFGKAHLLQATRLSKTPPEDLAKRLQDSIMNSGIETAGKLTFNQRYDDGYGRILATPLRDNCAVLDAFVTSGDKSTKPMQMVRAIGAARGNRDHWENTQENIFCAQALTRYARVFESVAPNARINTKLNETLIGTADIRGFKTPAKTVLHTIDEATPAKSVLQIDKAGDGRIYYAVRLRYALKDAPQDVNAGLAVTREVSVKRDGKWTLLPANATVSRGEVLRVDLFVDTPTARNFVVVHDALAGGLEAVNRDLATSSQNDDDTAQYDARGGSIWFNFDDWSEFGSSFWNFYHREIHNDSVRFYADYLPAGRYHLSYAAQVIADGTFTMLPTRAEEMYDADIYGLSNSGSLQVDATSTK